MKANSIESGKVYEITIGKNTTTVKVMSVDRRVNGQVVYDCMNVKTDKRLTIVDEKRFLHEIKPKTTLQTVVEAVENILPKRKKANTETTPAEPSKRGGKTKGQLSGLESAYTILKEVGEPLNVKEITDRAIAQKLWEPAGATPSATVAAAIMREMKIKGDDSRFFRAERGKFAVK